MKKSRPCRLPRRACRSRAASRQSCTGDNAKVIFTGIRKAFHPDTVTNDSGEGKHFSMAEEFIVDADHVMAVLLASMHRADKDRSPGGQNVSYPSSIASSGRA
jgi:hypothetical protein